MAHDERAHRPRRNAQPPQIDASKAHVARVYNYWLGGKDHFAADRQAGDAAIEADPYGLVAELMRAVPAGSFLSDLMTQRVTWLKTPTPKPQPRMIPNGGGVPLKDET